MIRTEASPEQFYLHARSTIERSRFRDEICWQENVSVAELTEDVFLRECAWVVVNSGFREAIARKIFPGLSLAFYDFQSTELILDEKDLCLELALDVFGNKRKVTAILAIAELVNAVGFQSFKHELTLDPINVLQRLPHIGPVTVWHLAKNLGCNVAKPDRHLVRLAKRFQYTCVHEFCDSIALATRHKVSVIDLILWRYLVSFETSILSDKVSGPPIRCSWRHSVTRRAG